MKMTPVLLILGSLLIFWATFFAVVMLPTWTISDKPSDTWRPPTDAEAYGRLLYIDNGCTSCHSQYVRPGDWDLGAERIAQEGDYHEQVPHLLGSQRTGPDLAEEGGEHPDDWHLAHFVNPRYTRPFSLMPRFEYVGDEKMRYLTAYVQSLGGKDADGRVARQRYWKERATAAYAAGPDANIAWIHSEVPQVWRDMPNPYPATDAALARGLRIYQMFCIGCHGPVGDGEGPAAPYLNPPPLNFTTLRRHLAKDEYIGGILYYQIMNGITGTAMPYFKKELESAKIWDVSNYVAVNFIGYSDANMPPEGIDAALEPLRPGELKHSFGLPGGELPGPPTEAR
jgi:cbb3-type cytochrome c oxidase subunit II